MNLYNGNSNILLDDIKLTSHELIKNQNVQRFTLKTEIFNT